jgi:rubrerythrin
VAEQQQSVENILRNAIVMELQGKEFFERAASMMSHPKARDMFSGLSKQEQRHIDVLNHQLVRLGRGLNMSSLEDALADSTGSQDRASFLDVDIEKFDLSEKAGELEVIQFGMEVERKSMEYYRKARDAESAHAAREIFDWLISEESSHLTILKAEYDNRAGSGFYYDDAQFSLETQ